MLVVPNAQHEPQYLQTSITGQDIASFASENAVQYYLLGNVLISELCEIIHAINVSPEPGSRELAHWSRLMWSWADDLLACRHVQVL